MEIIFIQFTKIFESFMYAASAVTEWLIAPWFTWGETTVSPIMIFSFAGLMAILAVMLIKLFL